MRVELLPEFIRELSRDSEPSKKREVVCCDAAMNIHCKDGNVKRILPIVVSCVYALIAPVGPRTLLFTIVFSIAVCVSWKSWYPWAETPTGRLTIVEDAA